VLKGVNKNQQQWSEEPAFVGQSCLRALEISDHIAEKTRQIIPCHNLFDMGQTLRMLPLGTPNLSAHDRSVNSVIR